VGTPTGMEEFLANQARILENFSPSAPEATVRSGGLNDQSAIIVALKDETAGDLPRWASRVPGAFHYTANILHSTIGVRDMVRGSDAALDHQGLRELHGDSLDRLSIAIGKVASGFAMDIGDISLGMLEVLCNQDSIIAAARKPGNGIMVLRQAIVEAAENVGLPLNPAWGLHQTLARFNRALHK
jgi:hypothetical protein